MAKTALLLALALLGTACATPGGGSSTAGGGLDHQAILAAQRERVSALPARGVRGPALGAARAYLGELEHHLGRGDLPQAMRVEGLLSGTLAATAATPSPEADPGSENQLALVSRLRELENESARRRISVLEKERDAAVAEVVRYRARVQGMASPAEAAAMFAEARVLVDRMAEEAVNADALEHLAGARRRLAEGKAEMEKGNPGGAAFLFDQVSNSYNLFRKGNPRQLVVTGAQVVLRDRPSTAGKALRPVPRNAVLEGLARQEGWVLVRDGSGAKGWVPADSVR